MCFALSQVSHHPPITACYCESKNFTFWQDVRVKTKFWGKSMELQPQGLVQLRINKYKDHYTWNKPTTCVHNLLAGQRWVDHYGEVNIVNKACNIRCKLTYAKVRTLNTALVHSVTIPCIALTVLVWLLVEQPARGLRYCVSRRETSGHSVWKMERGSLLRQTPLLCKVLVASR